MEPIELSGKTFCSNCGLTIGNVSPRDPIANITNSFGAGSPAFSDITAPKQVQPSVTPTSPIKDEAKELLGITDPETIIGPLETPVAPVGAVIDSPSDLGAVKLRVSSEEPATTPILDENQTGFYTNVPVEKPAIAEADEEISDDFSSSLESLKAENPDEELPVLTDEVPPLAQKVEIPDENDFDIPVLNPTQEIPPISLDAKIQEVDTLGASGILLDILNENYKIESREENLHALEAAEELIDKVEVKEDEDENTANDKGELDAGILEDQPQNPVEFPEITSPLSELEIEAPEDNVPVEENIATQEPETMPQTEKAVGSSDKAELSEEAILYKLPHELASLPNPKTLKETQKDIEEVEESLSHLENAEIPESIKSSHYYDPDTIAPVEVSPAPETVGEIEEPKIDPSVFQKDPSLKQEIVKNFLKEKIEKPKKKSFFSKKPKKIKPPVAKKAAKAKPEKKSPKQKSFEINKPWLLYPIFAILVVFLLLSSYYAYQNYQIPTEQNIRSTEQAQTTDFESKVPSEIPTGYEMNSSNFDETLNQLSIRYTFVNDKQKSLIYKQKLLTASGAEALDGYIKSRVGESYVTKLESNIAFTEFSNGTLVWTNDKFLFTIETQGYDLSHDLIYKMALSLG